MVSTRNYCALQGYKIACRDRLELHHIISFGKAQGNDAVKKILASNPPELTIHLCQRHHQRFGNSRAVRRQLLEVKTEEFGADWMRHIIDSLPWKIPHPSMSYDVLMTKGLKE